MHRVIVIGSVNHDRIWQLEEPLSPGKRLHFSSRTTQLGGGAYFTGRQLLDLGADVALVARMRDDERGLATLSMLAEAGFDHRHITVLPGKTTSVEILLEPHGERTIIAPRNAHPTPLDCKGPLVGEAAYINAIHLGGQLAEQIEALPLVLSQFPLRQATPRAADVVISSRTDIPDSPHDAWQRAVQVAGARLKTLVLTDGPRAIRVFDGRSITEVEPHDVVESTNTIGAGDRFAGSFLFALLEGQTAEAAAYTASRLTAEWLRGGSRHDVATVDET